MGVHALNFMVGSVVGMWQSLWISVSSCVRGLLTLPHCSVFVALLCWQECIHSGMRISCYNLLHSNARRQLASALLYQSKWWRREPEGKCSTLGAPYSLTPPFPWSSLNVCSIHQIYSTIVFSAQLFYRDFDNTAIPDEHLGSPAMCCRRKNEYKRGRNGRRHEDIQTEDHKTERLFSTPTDEEERLKIYLEWTIRCRLLHRTQFQRRSFHCHKKMSWSC